MRVEFSAPGRQVVEQINLRLQDDSRARQAAAAAFACVYTDHGSDHPFSVRVDHEPDVESIEIQIRALETRSVPTMNADVDADVVVEAA